MNSSDDGPQHGGDPGGLGAPPGHCAADGSIDLSTGVNPWPWPAPPLPAEALTLLPRRDTELLRAAAAYYGVPEANLLATAGSQQAIQLLPRLAAPGPVLMQAVAYEEHSYRWAQAGFEVRRFRRDEEGQLEQRIRDEQIAHLVLVSPNNPDASCQPVDRLQRWRQALPDSGLMMIDQAFADTSPDTDCAGLCQTPGVVILRSLGKFFGLPGLRLGFVLSNPSLLEGLSRALGPWPVSGPALHYGRQALQDTLWHTATRQRLGAASQRQAALLQEHFNRTYLDIAFHPLFTTMTLPLAQAQQLYHRAAAAGLWLRLYTVGDRGYLRWGLATDEALLARRLADLAQSESAVAHL